MADIWEWRHPNIVPYVGFVETDTHFGIASERTYGKCLRAEIDELSTNNDHLPEGVIRGWLAQIVNGLFYLHNKKIVHGSLDPSQVLLVGNGQVKLQGFGFSRGNVIFN